MEGRTQVGTEIMTLFAWWTEPALVVTRHRLEAVCSIRATGVDSWIEPCGSLAARRVENAWLPFEKSAQLPNRVPKVAVMFTLTIPKILAAVL